MSICGLCILDSGVSLSEQYAHIFPATVLTMGCHELAGSLAIPLHSGCIHVTQS